MSAPKMRHVIILLDSSFSMTSQKRTTIDGMNNFIDDQKRSPGHDVMSLICFGTEAKTIFERLPIREVQHIDENSYVPDGFTSLWDTIGGAITRYDSNCSDENEGAPTQTENGTVTGNGTGKLMVIVTDGEDTNSRRFSRDEIKALIQEKEREGWSFIYLSDHLDVARAGVDLGFTSQNPSVQNVVAQNLGAALSRHISSAVSDFRSTSHVPEIKGIRRANTNSFSVEKEPRTPPENVIPEYDNPPPIKRGKSTRFPTDEEINKSGYVKLHRSLSSEFSSYSSSSSSSILPLSRSFNKD